MKLAYELSELAIKDFSDIWNYTANKWSVKQANVYYELLFDVIDAIRSNPEIRKSIKEIKVIHRSKLAKSHMIIYKVERGTMFIDRILNQRMDTESLLVE